MKKIISIALIVALTGCAQPTIYGKPDNSGEQERKDFADCRYEAVKATASAESGSFMYGANDAIAKDIATSFRQEEIMKMCLESKGYRPQ